MLEEIIEQFLINSLQPGSKKVNENVHKKNNINSLSPEI